ncbi:MAG TPA: guanylate kinase [Woeseiaceae bacterium]|nr:guanylate kinase [Woeseiaceae bacterium]
MARPGPRGRLIVIAAPSGAGKTTLVRALIERNPDFVFSVSYTTRPKRPNEAHGRDYFFVSEEEFRRLQRAGEFLESARVFDHCYATSRTQVESELAKGRNVVLEIDWQGARQVRAVMPECRSIFILPPSVEALEERLRSRRTDSEVVIRRRLRDSLSDLSHWDEFDYVVINDDLERATDELEGIATGRYRRNRVGTEATRKKLDHLLV